MKCTSSLPGSILLGFEISDSTVVLKTFIHVKTFVHEITFSQDLLITLSFTSFFEKLSLSQSRILSEKSKYGFVYTCAFKCLKITATTVIYLSSLKIPKNLVQISVQKTTLLVLRIHYLHYYL
jgi:hypothetical protein